MCTIQKNVFYFKTLKPKFITLFGIEIEKKS